jgi:hypothetical protein
MQGSCSAQLYNGGRYGGTVALLLLVVALPHGILVVAAFDRVPAVQGY